MPLYEYECNECGHRKELLQRHGDPPLEKCPQCGGPVRKLFSAPAVQFKGTGWYVTDYGGKGKKPESEKSSSNGDKKTKKDSGDGASSGKSKESKSSKSSGGKE